MVGSAQKLLGKICLEHRFLLVGLMYSPGVSQIFLILPREMANSANHTPSANIEHERIVSKKNRLNFL